MIARALVVASAALWPVACAGTAEERTAPATARTAPPGEAAAPAERVTPIGSLTQLTATPDVAERAPAWSPDGRWILFTAGAPHNGDLWLVSPDGATRTQITHDPEIEMSPAWSPDGTRIAFESRRNGAAPAIWIFDLRDSSLSRLTNEPKRVHEPAWSPDGEEITYYGLASGDEQVWAIPAAGGAPRRLSHHVTQSWSAAWSPSGDSLVYSGYRNAQTGGSLFVMPKGGEGAACEHSRALTRRADHGWDRFPEWSRDGRWVVFAGQSRGQFDIWLVSLDGAVEERITDDPADDTEPTWSPDGRFVAFRSDRSGSPDLWLIDVSRWTATALPAHQLREAPNKK